jgi:hypothetical protein
MCKTNVKIDIYNLTHANMNMKRTWQGYDARSCLKLVLNKLKEMKNPSCIYTLQGPSSKKLPAQRSFLGSFYVCIK